MSISFHFIRFYFIEVWSNLTSVRIDIWLFNGSIKHLCCSLIFLHQNFHNKIVLNSKTMHFCPELLTLQPFIHCAIEKRICNWKLDGSQHSHQFLMKVVSVSNVMIKSLQLAANYKPFVWNMCHQTASKTAPLHSIQTTKCCRSQLLKNARIFVILLLNLLHAWAFHRRIEKVHPFKST